MNKLSRNRRDRRTLRVESLEKREMMAADSVVSLQNRTLNIVGTNSTDNVVINVVRLSRTGLNLAVRVNNVGKGVFPAADVDNVFANLGSGNDSFNFQFSAYNKQIYLQNLTVDTGRGHNEVVRVHGIRTANLNVNASQSVHTNVIISANVDNKATIRLGAGDDGVKVLPARINNFDLQAGAGHDALVLDRGVEIENANVRMGAGRDKLDVHRNALVVRGTIDAGADFDEFKNGRWNRPDIRARLVGFERG